MSQTIQFTLDGREVEAREAETIWQVAQRNGTDIPHLCFSPAPGYRADGNCRACMVEIDGERVLAASCIRTPTSGMVVQSASERAVSARKSVMELLVADQPEREIAHQHDSQLWQWAERMDTTSSRFPGRAPVPADSSHRDAGQSGCVHPLQLVCACLP